jgi:hypothetical protein
LIRAEPIKPVLPVTMIVSLHSAIRVRLSSRGEAGFRSSPFARGVHNLRPPGGSQVSDGYGIDYQDWSLLARVLGHAGVGNYALRAGPRGITGGYRDHSFTSRFHGNNAGATSAVVRPKQRRKPRRNQNCEYSHDLDHRMRATRALFHQYQ